MYKQRYQFYEELLLLKFPRNVGLALYKIYIFYYFCFVLLPYTFPQTFSTSVVPTIQPNTLK